MRLDGQRRSSSNRNVAVNADDSSQKTANTNERSKQNIDDAEAAAMNP